MATDLVRSLVSKSRVAAIGAGVGVAAASVITLLVIKGDPDPAERSEARETALVSPIAKTLSDASAKPRDALPTTDHVTAPTDAKAEADKAKAEAEAKAKADAAQTKADAAANKARQDAIAKARNAGVLGSQGGAFASLTGTGDISSGFDDVNIYGGLIGNTGGDMNGGLGTTGTGVGTIGRGGGYGVGAGGGQGGMRTRTAAVPTVSFGQPTVAPKVASAADPGNLDKAIVRRYLKRNVQKIQYCYEKQLLAKPGLKGTVTVNFAIDDTGHVTGAVASGVDTEVSSCIDNVISAIEFPKPRGTGGVVIGAAFTFKPAGS